MQIPTLHPIQVTIQIYAISPRELSTSLENLILMTQVPGRNSSFTSRKAIAMLAELQIRVTQAHKGKHNPTCKR